MKKDRKKKLDDIIDVIVETVDPLKIVLFGSAGKGELGPHSDFDLLVIVPDDTDRRETAKKIYRNKLGIGFAADIVVATTSDLKKHRDNPGLIYKTILDEGKTLYAA